MNRFSSGSAPSSQKVNIMVRPQRPVNNKIDEKTCTTPPVGQDVARFCNFTVDESGYYHVHVQCCLKNSGPKSVRVEFLQVGVCDDALEGYEKNFLSRVYSSDADSGYVLSESMAGIMRLEAGTEYVAWCNLGCDTANAFVLVPNSCHVLLYRLSA